MIELRHLRTLVALKESGSLAGAAKKRFVTQSALSHQIKELETRINSAIFVRKSKPLTFTHEGSRLLNLAEEILPKVIETESDLKRGLEGEVQQFKLAIDSHQGYRWLEPVLAQFKQAVPQVQIEVVTRTGAEALNALDAGELDIVLTSTPTPGHTVSYQHLFDYEIKLLVSKQHPLASKTVATANDLANQAIISYPANLARLDIYKHFLEPAGVAVGAHKHCELPHVLLQRVACNDGVTTLPSWSVTEAQALGLHAIKLGNEGLKKPLFGAYRCDATNSKVIHKWLQLVAQEGLKLQRPN
ncbi:LysR substrate-binding domain-containing protein [Shewanella maritima]|uniref:LysR substrate-binding domain-containing protein n=1 Tax=Shewanella maritima TaxID=2520507 RepID=UPI0037354634